MIGSIKPLSVLLVCGIAANAYLAWELHNRLPPSTAEIDRDLAALAAESATAESDDPQVKAEQALRAAIRAQTGAMLEQRRAAALRFVDVRYTVNGAAAPPVDSAQLAALEADITKQQAAVVGREVAVDEVRGGTIRTQRLASLSIAETTLALLERRHLALKHGIALPSASPPALSAPAAADKDAIATIEADIAERRRVIAETQRDADQYSGGLIKVTLLSRLATEQTTLAALEQRHLSLKHGLPPAPGLVPVAATTAAPEILAPVDADIASTRASIAAGEREASRYTGGLIYVTILSRIATEKTTLALLEQRRLSIKHGLMTAPSAAGDAASKPKGPPGAVVTDKEAL